MRRSLTICGLLLVGLCFSGPPAGAHAGNVEFESLITQTPAGLKARVLSGDDRLEVRNISGKLVTIEGYSGEPYARIFPNGRVQVNAASPATYLNEDRRGNATVPDEAKPDAPARWRTVANNGRFEFHDHRIHWMTDADPAQIRDDRATRRKVLDWKVPVTIGRQKASIDGTLWWRGTGGGPPPGAIIALVVLLFGSVVLVLTVRRRRRQSDHDDGPPPAGAEAW